MERERVGPAGEVIVLDVDEEEGLGHREVRVVSRELRVGGHVPPAEVRLHRPLSRSYCDEPMPLQNWQSIG